MQLTGFQKRYHYGDPLSGHPTEKLKNVAFGNNKNLHAKETHFDQNWYGN
jgi:hypothetical protein